MAINYYPSSSASTLFYGAVGSTEPNMRIEFNRIIEGSYPEISKKQWYILRKVRRDASGNPTLCACVNDITHEPDRDNYCPLCFGIGYYFDEEYIGVYRMLLDITFSNTRRHFMQPPGVMDPNFIVFYLEYGSEITQEDRLVEVQVDLEGEVVLPVNRLTQFRIDEPWPYRADYGKLEYWKLFTHKEFTKYLNPPTFGE